MSESKPQAAAAQTMSPAVKQIIDNMNYNDYLSAVYSYEQKSEECRRAHEKVREAYELRAAAKSKLDDVCNEERLNRESYKKILDGESSALQHSWESTNRRFDLRLATQSENERLKAKNDINKYKRDQASAVKEVKGRINKYEKKLKDAEDSCDCYTAELDKLSHFSGETFPPYNADVLESLKRAKKKHLLTKYQEEMLDENVETACGTWISGFDSLEKAEKELADSRFYKKLVKGSVTKEIISSAAAVSSVAVGVLLVIFVAILTIAAPSAFAQVVQSVVMTGAFGGLFSSVTHIARSKIDAVKNLPVSEKAMAFITFFLGGAAGCVLGLLLPALVVLNTISAVGCAFLFHRIMLTSYAAAILKKNSFLKDKARRRLFAEYEKIDNGSYNFRIYCYLNHNAVLTYTSIVYAEEKRNEMRKEKEVALKDKKNYANELKNAKEELNRLNNGYDLDNYKRTRMKQCEQIIQSYENGRPPKPDFEKKAFENKKDVLEPYNAEYKNIRTRISEAQAAWGKADNAYQLAKKSYETKAAFRDLVTLALRSWSKTPLPVSTDYSLVDALCADSTKDIHIIHHDLKPYVVLYKPVTQKSNPAETLHGTLYRFSRGLCRINPRRLIQINIIDYISDPNILINSRYFRSFFGKGIIGGIRTMKDFDIRLFSDRGVFKTFFKLFEMQCNEMSDLLKRSGAAAAECDIAAANRIAEPIGDVFPYQICFFVVPRADDAVSYPPPHEITALIDNGKYLACGILPFFFAQQDNIAPEWKSFLDNLSTEPYVFMLK